MKNDNLKKCPYCGQLINNEATICQFCGKDQVLNQINNKSDNNSSEDVSAQLTKLKELFDKQLITEEEYKTKKAKILGI